MKDILLILFIILAFLYLLYLDLNLFVKNKKLNKNPKRVSIINMEVINKYYVKGNLGHIGGDKVLSKYPDSYILELRYGSLFNRINDENLFNSLNIGDYLEVYLIEILDENKGLITYKFEIKQ